MTASGELAAWEARPLDRIKIRGLGPKSIAKFVAGGLKTVGDLIRFLPRDYLDFSNVSSIGDAPLEEPVLIAGRVISRKASKTKTRRMPILEILVDDGNGTLRVVWFNQPYLNEIIQKGMLIGCRGKIRFDHLGRLMNSPRFRIGDISPLQGIEPVYRQFGGLSSERIHGWIMSLLEQMPTEEILPPEVLADLGFPSRLESLRRLHEPADSDTVSAIKTRDSPAFRRMVFEEFLGFQHRLQTSVSARKRGRGAEIQIRAEWLAEVLRCLPFEPTEDQRNVIGSLVGELKLGRRLMALIQGDVGCGKTLIGLVMAYLFKKDGYQSALLCPTNVLARQHRVTAQRLLGPLGMRVAMLSAQDESAELASARAKINSGAVDLVIGTHKLFQKDVHFARLGLAMVDEQHRFGVNQRRAMIGKGHAVHYLAFTATPIPRSLAMTLYGDYQVLQIRQRPANRGRTHTILKKSENRDEVVEFAKKRIRHGDSVFWVFPLIEGEEEARERSATTMYRAFCQDEFAGFGVGLVHGRMDKDQVTAEMEAFRMGKLQVLVATTVIEVGIDIPDAAVMVIEQAHRFGLSQLHQLRGRVGRHTRDGYCFLVVDQATAKESLQRLQFLAKHHDGFEIAEYDLAYRGAGEFLGRRQSGDSDFEIGDPWRDRSLMREARDAALKMIDKTDGQEKGMQS